MALRKPDIGFIPTAPPIVEAILALADITAADTVYDLGCGDGRIVIAAAQRFGCRGCGIDIDPVRISEAQQAAQQAGVDTQVQFIQGNLYAAEFSAATVVILYLLPHLNVKLLPQLQRQLQPGTRVISRDFTMGDWPPEKSRLILAGGEEATLYRWTMPLNRRSN